jgi:hypothetical protein
VGRLLSDFVLGFVEIDSGVSKIILLHSDRVENGLVQSRVNVSLAQKLGLVESLVNKLYFDIFLGA